MFTYCFLVDFIKLFMKGEQMTLYSFLEQASKDENYDFVDFLIYDSKNKYQSDFQGLEIKCFLDESAELGDTLQQKIVNIEPCCFEDDGRLYELTLYIDRPLRYMEQWHFHIPCKSYRKNCIYISANRGNKKECPGGFQ